MHLLYAASGAVAVCGVYDSKLDIEASAPLAEC
jgi:hypothetical protein